MTKRTIEIDDNLDDLIDGHKEEILDDFIDYLEETIDLTDFDEYYQEQGCDFVHESADSYTPIYNSDIDGLWYLYGDEFADAFENAGFDMSDNYKQQAIYCYISDKGFEFQRLLENKFNDWIAEEKPRPIKEFIEELKELII